MCYMMLRLWTGSLPTVQRTVVDLVEELGKFATFLNPIRRHVGDRVVKIDMTTSEVILSASIVVVVV